MDKSAVLSLQERFGIAHDCFRDQSYPALMGGWRRLTDTQATSPHYKESGLYAALYARQVSTPSGDVTRYAIGFRGYDEPEDFDDMVHITMDSIPDQVADGFHFARMVIEKYQITPGELECVGHSLGGYLSKAVGLMLQSKEIYAFNSPRLDKESLPMLSRLRRSFVEHADDIHEFEITSSVVSVVSQHDRLPKVGDFAGREILVSTDNYHHRLPSLEEAFVRAFIPPEEHTTHPRAVPKKFLSAWNHFLKIIG